MVVGEPRSSLTVEVSRTWPLSTLLMSSGAIDNAKLLYANSQYVGRVQCAEPGEYVFVWRANSRDCPVARCNDQPIMGISRCQSHDKKQADGRSLSVPRRTIGTVWNVPSSQFGVMFTEPR